MATLTLRDNILQCYMYWASLSPSFGFISIVKIENPLLVSLAEVSLAMLLHVRESIERRVFVSLAGTCSLPAYVYI
jgi:hypothetical protein